LLHGWMNTQSFAKKFRATNVMSTKSVDIKDAMWILVATQNDG